MRKPKVKSAGNSRFLGRSVMVDRAQDMRRYNRLPREVRDALKNLAGDLACIGLAGLLKKGVDPSSLALWMRSESTIGHRELMVAEFGRVPEDGAGEATRRLATGQLKAPAE